MPLCCVIPMCTVRYSKNDDRSISFHHFPNPIKSHQKYQRWLSFVRDIRQDGHIPGRNACLCSLHFVESDFNDFNGRRRRLKPDAVPSRARDFSFIECVEPLKESSDSEGAQSAELQPNPEEVAQVVPVERPPTDSQGFAPEVTRSQGLAPVSDTLAIHTPEPAESAVRVGAIQKFVVLPQFRSILPKPQPQPVPTTAQVQTPMPTAVDVVQKPSQEDLKNVLEDLKNDERLWSHFILNRNGYEAQCRTCGQIVRCRGGSTKTMKKHLLKVHSDAPVEIPEDIESDPQGDVRDQDYLISISGSIILDKNKAIDSLIPKDIQQEEEIKSGGEETLKKDDDSFGMEDKTLSKDDPDETLSIEDPSAEDYYEDSDYDDNEHMAETTLSTNEKGTEIHADIAEPAMPQHHEPELLEESHSSEDKFKLDIEEIKNVISAHSLTSVMVGDYMIIMRSDFDVVIQGEPHLAFTLLLNMKSGRYISRIWSQTVAVGNGSEKSELEEILKYHFDRGKPCLGYSEDPINNNGLDYFTCQYPMPRKISKQCRRVVKYLSNCGPCSRLKFCNEMRKDIVKSVENKKGDGSVLDLANQALYLQETAKKYPDVIRAGKPFKIQIKTEDSQGILQDKVLLVDPTKTLQQGGIMETLKEEGENPDQNNLNENENQERYKEMEVDKFGLESSIEKEEDRPDIPKNVHRRRCKICMDMVDDLKEHRKNVHADPIQWRQRKRCKICGELVKDNDVQRHSKDNHPELYQCETCGQKFESVMKAKSHRKIHKPPSNKCSKCDMSFDNYNERRVHEAKEHPKPTQTCEICGMQTKNIWIHKSQYHLDPQYQCSQCPEKFRFHVRLKEHERKYHSTDPKYECKECGQREGSAGKIARHVRNVHTKPRFSCSYCGKMLREAIQ